MVRKVDLGRRRTPLRGAVRTVLWMQAEHRDLPHPTQIDCQWQTLAARPRGAWLTSLPLLPSSTPLQRAAKARPFSGCVVESDLLVKPISCSSLLAFARVVRRDARDSCYGKPKRRSYPHLLLAMPLAQHASTFVERARQKHFESPWLHHDEPGISEIFVYQCILCQRIRIVVKKSSPFCSAFRY